LGVVVFYLLLSAGFELETVAIVSIIITTVIRLVAMKYNWNLPKAREK